MAESADRPVVPSPIHALAERSLAARTHAIWLGFGLLLSFIVAGFVYSFISVRNLQAMNSQSRAESRERDELLDRLSNDIYRTSTVARDYLLESKDRQAETYRMQLEALRVSIFESLAAYEVKAPASEIASLAAFHQNIDAFWNVVEPTIHWGPQTRKENAEKYLAETLLPKGQDLENLAKEIALRDERELEELDRRLQTHNLDYQREMVWGSVLTLIVGFVVSSLSIRRIQRLEREAELRFEEAELAKQQLRDLSSQLVTAQEDERRKLSRELHDQLGQTMSALVTELGRLEHDGSANEAVKERASAARQLAEDNVRSIRDTALLLRPSMLDDLGLVPALRWQAREVRRRSNLKVRVLAEEELEGLPDAYGTCIFRVVQEALHNCVKHANATEAKVILKRTPEGLLASVQDDGVGFNPAGERGVGLLGMEERVTRLGGKLRIESQPGHGTVLSMLFPNQGIDASAARIESTA
jgi:signal transduction histidine kinase